MGEELKKVTALSSTIAVAFLGLSACASGSQGFTEAASSDPQSFKNAIKGEWSCGVTGDNIELHSDSADGEYAAAFRLYPQAAYNLKVESEKWSFVEATAYKGAGVKGNGTWDVDGSTLSFKVEHYTFTDGSTTSPVALGRNVVGHDFTIEELPEKITDSAQPKIKTGSNVTSEFRPVAESKFRLSQDGSTLTCTK